MKIAVFDDYRIGVVEGDKIYDATTALPSWLSEVPEQRINWLAGHWPEASIVVASSRKGAQERTLADVKLLAPSPSPRHIFAAPANYRKHVGELGNLGVTKVGRSAREQGFFLKAPGSLTGAGGSIQLPKGSSRRFDYEAELAVIIGRPGRDIPRGRAFDHVFGYACLIDVTMRIERDTGEEERSMRKSFSTFSPLGPYLVTADEVPEPGRLRNRLWVNGEIRQDATTADMIVDIAELIELISSVLPLSAGDVIATGTPEGVGQFKSGDELRIAIEGVGEMAIFASERPSEAPRRF
jgi:2-keto-4-pentenoate hydratase/2-oxohepta-3-ene-1,7-dioic acid hydratase in catechol pathway